MPKPGNKPASTKVAITKPAQKAVQPKKQVPKEATKKVTKPVPVTPKQKNEKRKREENESTPVHDVDKKMKEAPGSKVVATGKRIIYTNVPETAQRSDFEALFAGLPAMPFIRILSYYNKERVGDVYVYFNDEESFNQAAALTNPTIGGQELTVLVDNSLDDERSVYVARFPGISDKSEIAQFFDGCQISKIHYVTTSYGRIQRSFFIEFADIESKQAALEKSGSLFKETNVILHSYDPNRPKSERKPRKTKAPAKKAEKKAAPQKKAAATANPNQNKTASAKNPKQAKAAPAKNPNQKKPGQKMNPNQKNKTPKPAAQSQKKGSNGTAKAQKKN